MLQMQRWLDSHLPAYETLYTNLIGHHRRIGCLGQRWVELGRSFFVTNILSSVMFNCRIIIPRDTLYNPLFKSKFLPELWAQISWDPVIGFVQAYPCLEGLI